MTTPRDAYDPKIDATAPAYESAAYRAMLRDLIIVNDCYEGTSAIAAKGDDYQSSNAPGHYSTVYLRKFSAESSQDYAVRLATSKFWNAFRRTVNGLVGLIFRKNPVLDADVPEQIAAHVENIDLQGTHLDVFAKERCTKGMIDGHSLIYIDMPQAVPTDNPAITRESEKTPSRRPYWIPVNKEQVLSCRVEKINGIDTPTQVVILECLIEPEGEFGEAEVYQYRILRPGSYEVRRYDESGKTWVIVDGGVTSLSYIPLVPFYAQQTGFLQSTPPLLDVAHENLRHYNLQSSLDRVLDLCNVPTPVLKGRPGPPYDDLVVGKGVIDIPTDGAAEYLEPSGVAIECTQNEIDRSKANIASLGLLLLSSAPKVTKTATETTVEFTAETSELSAIARNLQDCLERCLMIHADYLGIDTGGSIKVNQDFVKLAIDPLTWQRLQDDVAANRLTLETYWKILENKAEILPEDFKAENEKKALDAQPTLTKIQIERARVGLKADQQAASGDPAAIQQRIMDKAAVVG